MGEPSVHQLFKGEPGFPEWTSCDKQGCCQITPLQQNMQGWQTARQSVTDGAASRNGKVEINQNVRYSWRCRICKLQAHAR